MGIKSLLKFVGYKRFLANARPDLVFKYLSKSNAFCRSVKAMAVLTCHGFNFDVWGLCRLLWDFKNALMQMPALNDFLGILQMQPPFL